MWTFTHQVLQASELGFATQVHRGLCGDLTLEPLQSELVVGGLVLEGLEGPIELGAFQLQPVVLLAEVFNVVGARCQALCFQPE